MSEDEDDENERNFEDGDDLGEATIAKSNQFSCKVVRPNASTILFDWKKSGTEKNNLSSDIRYRKNKAQSYKTFRRLFWRLTLLNWLS